MKTAAKAHLEQLHRDFEAQKDAIRTRLADFAAVPAEEYFYELVYCLLTPQSSAVNAGKVVALLQQGDALHRTMPFAEILFRKEHYIRFHNTKAARILKAREQMPDIEDAIRSLPDAPQLRLWLVRNVDGFGLKEASHFLRNIGRRDLAILDRHILKNLKGHGVLTRVPETLPARRYLEIEQRFAQFALLTGISMDELDLLFWSRETGRILK